MQRKIVWRKYVKQIFPVETVKTTNRITFNTRKKYSVMYKEELSFLELNRVSIVFDLVEKHDGGYFQRGFFRKTMGKNRGLIWFLRALPEGLSTGSLSVVPFLH